MKFISQLEGVAHVGNVFTQLFLVFVLQFPWFLFTVLNGIVPLNNFLKNQDPETPIPPNQELSLTITTHLIPTHPTLYILEKRDYSANF